MKASQTLYFLLNIYLFFSCTQTEVDPFNYDLKDYEPQSGLIAQVNEETLTITWDGDQKSELRMSFVIEDSIPVIKNLDIRSKGEQWKTIATLLKPEYRIVSAVRRVTQQQTEPLEELGIPLTAEKLDEIKWDAFWDAPLYISDKPPTTRQSSIPASEPFANHPGMPRRPNEVKQSKAKFNISECVVKTNGARIEVLFKGVLSGIFRGYLQYDIYKGSNLIRQMLVAKTDEKSVAFKYDTGLSGFDLQETKKLKWRDLSGKWQDNKFDEAVNTFPIPVKTKNRLISSELNNGSVAVFPPPHSFFWARESEQNLGYSWYRKDSNDRYAIGIRQAEQEEEEAFLQNFALYNARPGKWQQMPMFIYISESKAEDAIHSSLAYTNGDYFKAIDGYKVMGHHYHVGMVKRLKALGGFDHKLNDITSVKGVGINIFGIVDGVRGQARHDKGEAYMAELAEYYDAARSQSDEDFLVMPSDENSTGGRPPFLGGHYDIIPSKPIFWRPARAKGQPVRVDHEIYGTAYNIASPEDLMKMTEYEDVLISLPHPNTKRSTGYPEAIVDKPHFQHDNYFALGYRWGMGIDASETRLSEYRFLKLWNETNNKLANDGKPPKYALAISEARSDKGKRGKPPIDDIYGMSPVNYLKIDKVPTVDDMGTIVKALKRGDFFVTTGEILIHDYQVQQAKNQVTISSNLEWTFPLDFVEVVWGDGLKTQRKIIDTADLGEFGSKNFQITLDISNKKWIRFAAWDVAKNGALTQPIGLLN